MNDESNDATEAAPVETPNHNAEMVENQGKDGKVAPRKEWRANKQPTVAARLDARIRDIEELLFDKEAHQMRYVFEKWPEPYYTQWKAEANELTALRISLKHRRAARKKVG